MFIENIQHFVKNIDAFQVIILLLGFFTAYAYGALKPFQQLIFKFIFGAVVIFCGGVDIVHSRIANQAILVIPQNTEALALFINGVVGGLIFCALLFLFSLLEQMVLCMLTAMAASFSAGSLLIGMGMDPGTLQEPNILLLIIVLVCGLACALLARKVYHSHHRLMIESAITGAFLIIGTMGNKQIVPGMLNQFAFMVELFRKYGFDMDRIASGIKSFWEEMLHWPPYIQGHMDHFILFAGSGFLIQFAIYSYRKNRQSKQGKLTEGKKIKVHEE